MTEYIYEHVQSGADHMGKQVELPTLVQREEIVRCRDCAYYDKYPNDEISVCYRFDNEQPIVEPDGFCALGKLRGEGECDEA